MDLRIVAPLSLFTLDCTDINEEHVTRAQSLKDTLITYQVDVNREQNKESVFPLCFPIISIAFVVVVFENAICFSSFKY